MLSSVQVSINSGDQNSSPITLDANSIPVGILFPSAFDGTSVTIQASYDGGMNWYTLYNPGGVVVSVPVVANGLVALDPSVNYALRHFRLVANTQSATRILRVAVEKVS